MTPEQASTLKAIVELLKFAESWPIGSILALMIIGPWIGSFLLFRSLERRYKEQEIQNSKRFEMVVKMYENNVILVENYERLANEQVDTIRLATSATIELTTWLKGRIPCHERLRERLIKA